MVGQSAKHKLYSKTQKLGWLKLDIDYICACVYVCVCVCICIYIYIYVYISQKVPSAIISAKVNWGRG